MQLGRGPRWRGLLCASTARSPEGGGASRPCDATASDTTRTDLRRLNAGNSNPRRGPSAPARAPGRALAQRAHRGYGAAASLAVAAAWLLAHSFSRHHQHAIPDHEVAVRGLLFADAVPDLVDESRRVFFGREDLAKFLKTLILG